MDRLLTSESRGGRRGVFEVHEELSTVHRSVPLDRSEMTIPYWVRRYGPHAAAVGWFVLLAFLYLSPALKDGAQFVPTNIGQTYSPLTHLVAGPLPFHNNINSDIVTNNLPWEIFDWNTARAGEIPLWNSLSGTGLPQLFNFQSAPLSLPMLASYLFPLAWMSLVVIATKLVLAGTGAYLCCRVLGTGGLGATFAGSTFMLGGSFAGWLGWAISGPYVLAGWVLAGLILCYRSSGKLRHVLLLALAVAILLLRRFPRDVTADVPRHRRGGCGHWAFSAGPTSRTVVEGSRSHRMRSPRRRCIRRSAAPARTVGARRSRAKRQGDRRGLVAARSDTALCSGLLRPADHRQRRLGELLRDRGLRRGDRDRARARRGSAGLAKIGDDRPRRRRDLLPVLDLQT